MSTLWFTASGNVCQRSSRYGKELKSVKNLVGEDKKEYVLYCFCVVYNAWLHKSDDIKLNLNIKNIFL